MLPKEGIMKFSLSKMVRLVPVLIALLVGAVNAHAVAITPSSYDMPNGYGQGTASGMYNYWDANYTGTGNKTTDGAYLSGGLGKLTDGVVATQSWLQPDGTSQQNIGGTGPYVGWTNINPTIIFHFASQVTIDNITFYIDNPSVDRFGNPRGGVAAPLAFTIAGNNFSSGFDSSQNKSPFTGPGPINVDNLGLLNVQDIAVTIIRDTFGTGIINEAGNTDIIRFWLMLSEVTFDDGLPAPVPEPSTMILFGTGLAGLALLRNRRRK